MELFSQVNNVGIIDMDGFTINKKFYCKELGIIRVGDVAAQSYFFDFGIRWCDLTEKDRKSCAFVMKHIHKLPFGVPRGITARNVSALGSTVTSVYCEIKRDESSLLAYKGGHYERDLLASLGIPSINLENFGCPKAGELIDELIWLELCRNHTVNEAYLHCPKVEVEAFEHWLQDKLLRQ